MACQMPVQMTGKPVREIYPADSDAAQERDVFRADGRKRAAVGIVDMRARAAAVEVQGGDVAGNQAVAESFLPGVIAGGDDVPVAAVAVAKRRKNVRNQPTFFGTGHVSNYFFNFFLPNTTK